MIRSSSIGRIVYWGVGLFIGTASPGARAARTVLLPPLSNSSVHGGIQNNANTSWQRCRAIGYDDTPGFGPQSQNLVGQASHILIFSFTNLSNVTQNISIKLRTGSEVTSTNSGGVSSVNLSTPGPGLSLNFPALNKANLALTKTGTKDSSLEWVYGVTCSQAACDTADDIIFGYGGKMGQGNTIDVLRSKYCGAATPPPMQLCFAIASTLLFEVTVAQDQGAVVGRVTPLFNQCGGVGESISSGGSLEINGGRPF